MLMGGLGSVVSSRVQAEQTAKTFLGFLPAFLQKALCMLFLCASHAAPLKNFSTTIGLSQKWLCCTQTHSCP